MTIEILTDHLYNNNISLLITYQAYFKMWIVNKKIRGEGG